MEYTIPRVVISGTNSGSGKTTVCCALLKAFKNRMLKVGAFKCGPDYIDPMFHSKIIGTECTNLDSFFFSENILKFLLSENGANRDINIIEGVMGFYDGLNLTDKASTYEIACRTSSPTILTIDAKGASLSILALIEGFLRFRLNSEIVGVILNRCSPSLYKMLAKEIENNFGGRVTPLGFMPEMAECRIESRHLGLITADEIADLDKKLCRLAQAAEEFLELDKIYEIANKAKKISYTPVSLPRMGEKIRLGIAYDNAFCFYYADNIKLLEKMGAELVYFSPLSDTALPENINGLIFGGGYPELYAKRLSENISMLKDVKDILEKGVPCIAECGGFMYLTESIDGFKTVGFLNGKSFNTQKLSRFGYVTLKSEKDNMLCKAGEEIAAHEFHYYDCENSGEDFIAYKQSGRKWSCVIADDRIYAGFPHFHFYSNPEFAKNFYKKCLRNKNYDKKH